MIRGVIFDLDGVLVRTDTLHFESWRQLADAEGLRFDVQLNEQLRGLSRMESLEVVLAASGRVCSAAQKQALADRKNAAFLALAERLTPADLPPGVAAILDELHRRGIKTAVASSSRNTRPILTRVGLAERFEVVVDANDVPLSKPDPTVFLRAAERLGLPPSQCLVIEDGLAGVEAARRAGMAVLGLGPAAALPGVPRRADNLAQIAVDDLLASA